VGLDDEPRSVRLRIDLAYDGSGFSGWAAQPGRRTVEDVLAAALGRILRLPHPPGLTVAGRTDAGVHARGQVVHADVPAAAWPAAAGGQASPAAAGGQANTAAAGGQASPAAAGGQASTAAAGGQASTPALALMLSWFDSAGVEEIPPLFAGEVVEKLDLDPETGEPGGVVVAAIAPVGRLDQLRASVHAAAARLAASGVRRFWIYRALDDQAEVMILQEIATERQAEQWIRHPDAAAGFMAAAGVGAYPPLFVGRLVQAIEVPGT